MSSGSRAAGCSATWTPPRAPAPPVRAAFPRGAPRSKNTRLMLRQRSLPRRRSRVRGAGGRLLILPPCRGGHRQWATKPRRATARPSSRACASGRRARCWRPRRPSTCGASASCCGSCWPAARSSRRRARAARALQPSCRRSPLSRHSRRRARARACLPASLTPASPQDFANDELVELDDRTRLCVWRTMSDEELAPVLSNAEARATRRQRADARHLLRWCLKGDAAARPTVAQARRPAAAAPGTRLLCRSASARG